MQSDHDIVGITGNNVFVKIIESMRYHNGSIVFV